MTGVMGVGLLCPLTESGLIHATQSDGPLEQVVSC